jgi:hypothetical protein
MLWPVWQKSDLNKTLSHACLIITYDGSIMGDMLK